MLEFNGVETLYYGYTDNQGSLIALGPIGFGLNELSDISKLSTGEYNLKDFMLSSTINYAATKIPAIAITMVFVWAIHTDPVPANYHNPVCPKDNTNIVIRHLSH